MGYRDYKLILHDSTQVAASGDCTYFIDTEVTVPGWEKGMPAAVIINSETVTTAATGYTFEVCHKISEPGTGDATLVSVIALATHITAGSEIIICLPIGIELLRYVRLYFSETGGTEDYVFSAYFTPMLMGV